MLSGQHMAILKMVCEAEYVTAEILAKKTEISDRSVRKRIHEINAELKKQQICIQAKARYGFFVGEQDRERLKAFLGESRNTEILPVTGEERIQFLAVYLLNHPEYIRMDDLSEMLYVSKGTLSGAVRQVEGMYRDYRIRIERRPNYGIRAVGDEFDIRKFLCDVYVRQEFLWEIGREHQQQTIQKISRLVLDHVKKYNIRLSERAYRDFVDYIFVSMHRIRSSYQVRIQTDKIDYIEKKDYYFTEALAEELKNVYLLEWSESEKLALALQLIGKNIRGDEKKTENFVIQSRIDKMVSHMLDAIYKEYSIDFRDNLELRMSLNQHMVPMDIRLRYGISMENPTLEDVKKNYRFAFNMASYAALMLEELYHTKVSEAETGYLAVIFELALEKEKTEIDKKNLLIVCGSGRGSARLLEHKLKNEFALYIEHIYACNLYELETFDFSKVHYAVATVPIQTKIPVPILHINEFVNREDLYNIQNMLERGADEVVRQYFQEALFFTDLQGNTKEEVLSELTGKMGEVYELTDCFLDSVLEREMLYGSDFGNLTALPNPAKLLTKKTAVAVGITKAPVFWGRNEVQVIFLTSVGKEKDANIQKFYKMVVKFFSNGHAVKELISEQKYTTLLRLLEIEQQ